MNQSITRLTLDVSVKAKQASVSVSQFDTMRRLVFSLVNRGLPYKLEAGVYAYMSATTSANLPLFGSCVIQDGAVHFDVPPEMTSEIGVNECELILHASDHSVLTTNGFDVVIYETTAGDYAEDAISGNHFYAMLDATTAANNAAKNANDAKEDAEAAAGRAVEISQTLENKLATGEFKGDKGDPGDPGPQGPQGNQGVKGDKGDTVFIRYSAYANGLNFTDTWSAGQSYIGMYVGKEAPTDPGQYKWVKFTSNIRETVTVNLSADGWVDKVQTVESHYIGTESAAFVSPTPTSMAAYLESGVMLDSISERTLTFTCVSVPAEDISVEVNIIEPLVIEAVSVPKPTAEDNGKFLRVVEGGYALVALQDVSVEGM